MKFSFFCLFFFLPTLLFGQMKTDEKRRCTAEIEEIAYFWKLDSLGSNGFRRCAVKSLLECGLDTIRISFLEKNFGKPNRIVERHPGLMEYRYFYFDALAMPDDYNAPATTAYISFVFKKKENWVFNIFHGEYDR